MLYSNVFSFSLELINKQTSRIQHLNVEDIRNENVIDFEIILKKTGVNMANFKRTRCEFEFRGKMFP